VLGPDHAAAASYVTLANPTTPERAVMRHSLLNSVLEIVAENSKNRDRVQVFEIGHIYVPRSASDGEQGELETEEEADLPVEPRRLALALTGPREETGWLSADTEPVQFFDLKGVVETFLAGLHISDAAYVPAQHAAFHPGRVAELRLKGHPIGVLGQIHPRVAMAYEIRSEDDWPVLAAELDLDFLLTQIPDGHKVHGVQRFPPVQQDIALIVDETVPADKIQRLILRTGQPLLTEAHLFDVYHGEQLGPGKKSLAFNLTFQSNDRTLTDKVVARQQNNIVKRLEREFGARLRS
jgi:phenylalanyl-tRNA synthetase beta chain